MGKAKNKKARIISIVVIAIILIVALLLIFGGNKNGVVKVTVTKVERRTITQTVSAVGKIEPETKVKVSSETSGEIIFLGVREGDTVRRGQLLVRIKPDIVETQLEQAKSAVEAAKLETEVLLAEKNRAESELRRAMELYQKEFISKQEFELAKASYDRALASYNASLARLAQAQATYKQIQKSAERTIITAPIDGIVAKLSVEKGEKVVGVAQMPGTEIMEIANLSVMNAIVEVDENDIVNVKIGDSATIEIDALPDELFKGIVVETGHSAISTALGSQDQVTNFKVKIRLIEPDPRLRPGMTCNVEIRTLRKENVLAVPLQAVTIRLDNPEKFGDIKPTSSYKEEDDNEVKKKPSAPSVVFVNDKGKAKMVKVKTGISDKGYIEIIEGLDEGQEVVSGSFMAISKLLKDGSPLKIDTVKTKMFKK